MQPEREDGEATGLGPAQVRALEQPAAEHLGATLGIDPGELGERRGGARTTVQGLAFQPSGHLSEELPGAGLLAYPERRLDPGCEGVATERLVVLWRRFFRGNGIADVVADWRGWFREVDLRRRTFKGFADNLLRRKGHSEQGLRHLRHFELLFVAASAACHRGGGSDAKDVVAEGVAASANEHRDIGALAPAIGVQLVEDEELEALGGSHQLAVLASREQKLQHHVVGEKNVRGVGPDGVPGFASLLPGIAFETNQGLAIRVTPVDELPELLALAVGEGVHRVDHHGLDAAAGSVAEHVVHDRYDVGEALSGAGAGRQYVGAALLRLADRVALVLVEEELPAAVVGLGLVDPEDSRALRVEKALLDQVIDRASGPERRVELEERFRPEALGVENAVDESFDPRVTNLDEAPDVVPIVGDEVSSEVKDVHPGPSRHSQQMRGDLLLITRRRWPWRFRMGGKRHGLGVSGAQQRGPVGDMF